MSSNGLLDKSRLEIKLGDYCVAPATALTDSSLLPRVQEYRRQSASRMYPLDRDDIRRKVPTAEYHVSRKVDGEFTVLVYHDGEIFTLNPGGTVRVGLPFLDKAGKLLSKGKVKHALIAGELYVDTDDHRPRVHDVTSLARQPKSAAQLRQLRFAVCDIISLDGDLDQPFAETWKSIERIFGKGDLVHPVEAKTAKNAADVVKIFETWVKKEGAEGIVLRSETAGIFKIKPRHTLDLAVLGFTESVGHREGLLHDLLVGIVRQDGTMQVLTRVGGGFDEEERRTMLADLKDMVVESEYAEVNSDHVAYQMVRPEWVVEISCLDLISQTTRGGPVNRMVLDYSEDCYHVVRRMPLASVISPQFLRRREDKSVNKQDVRIEQVNEIVEVPLADRDARQMMLPKSELLRREVFTKELKGETMVRKFAMWKTNKESESDEYPAYVLHYTDFSPNRKAPLAREVRVSSSAEQISSLLDEMRNDNIKKGWEQYSATVVESKPPSEEKPKPKTAPKKTATTKKKKPVAKKTAPSEEAKKPATRRKKKSG